MVRWFAPALAMLVLFVRPVSVQAVDAATPPFPFVCNVVSGPDAHETGQDFMTAAAGAKVRPLLFVPRDLTPSSVALARIKLQMAEVQRFYAEQLGGATFEFHDPEIVIGERDLAAYYGGAFPPAGQGTYAYKLWDQTFAELTRRKLLSATEVTGVFFESGGAAGVGLGGGNRFLLEVETLAGGCTTSGCAITTGQGGIAHELGHALGLPHPPGDEFHQSLMGTGFYRFPATKFLDTATSPEKSKLRASTYIGNQSAVAADGFEECLAHWRSEGSTPECIQSGQRSGARALRFSAAGTASASYPAASGRYELGGWAKASSISTAVAKITAASLANDGTVLATSSSEVNATEADVWRPFAVALDAPAGTAAIRIVLAAGGATPVAFDSVLITPSSIPAIPIPTDTPDGVQTNSDRPVFTWTEVAGASSYELQVALSREFIAPLFTLRTTTNRAGTPSANRLPYYRTAYWRVRAASQAGAGEWSPVWRIMPYPNADDRNDRFPENSQIHSRWTWIRPTAQPGYIGRPPSRGTGGYVALKALTGDLTGPSNSAQNLLVQRVPQGDFAISSHFDVWGPLETNGGRGGLLLYADDDHFVHLARTFEGSHKIVLLAEHAGVTERVAEVPFVLGGSLKLTYDGGAVRAFYSADGYSWLQVGRSVSMRKPPAFAGLAAMGGANASAEAANFFFDWFYLSSQEGVQTVRTRAVRR